MIKLNAHEIKNSKFLRERTKSNSKKFILTEFSAMCEKEVIDLYAFLNPDILNLSVTMSKRQFLKTWKEWQLVKWKKVKMF